MISNEIGRSNYFKIVGKSLRSIQENMPVPKGMLRNGAFYRI